MSAERQSTSLPDLTQENVRAIIELERRAVGQKSWSERASDRISKFVGSLRFVLFHAVAFVTWAAWNAGAPPALRFDPYPYGLLTFIVSMEGVLIATFVLIAQNRLTQNSERRAHLHLQVALLAEQELTLVLRMLRTIAAGVGVPPEAEGVEKAEKLAEETDVEQLMTTLDQELGDEKRRA